MPLLMPSLVSDLRSESSLAHKESVLDAQATASSSPEH